MKKNTPNPFNIRVSPQDTFILRSCGENYLPLGGLASTRKFDVYTYYMKKLGTITTECSEEKGHEIVGHDIDSVWEEEVIDGVTEKDFRAAVKHLVTTYHTNRYY